MVLLDVKSILAEYKIVENVNVLKENIFKTFAYELVFKCELIVDEKNRIPIVVCIPSKWNQDLINIYVENYTEIDFLPHIDNNGKICLFETEGILVDWNLPGILIQSLFRAQDILQEGILGKNHEDFIKEFELYWSQLPQSRLARFVVPVAENSQNVKCIIKPVSQRKKEKQSEYLKRLYFSPIYAGKDSECLKRWKVENVSIVNAAYFVVHSQDNIFPPDIRKPVSLNYLYYLLQMIPEKDVFKLLSGLGKNKVIIFSIKQPTGITNYIGFFVKGGLLEKCQGTYVLNNVEHLQPLAIRRSDKRYLMKRTSEAESDMGKRKILVVGCGSIGGHLICELAKSGYEDITIVDDDILSEENIFRHVLGMEYVSKYKCVALEEYVRKNIPEVSIKSIAEKFEDAVLEEDLELSRYNLIISATGNHNLNRWLNSFVMDHKVNIPVIYAWNEVYGIGNHVACIKYGNEGCYECFFGRSEKNDEIYDKSSYCAPGQKITQNAGGCGKNYVPYGDMISLKTVLICLNVVKEIFENGVESNILISVKGDDSYLKKHGLKTSERYSRQKEDVKKLMGCQFVNKKCGVCGGYNREE